MRIAHPDTLWRNTAGPKPVFPAATGARRADVAVIGGGIAGLTTAMRLAERGVSTVLLEAEQIGFGASGRNAGFVVPNFSKADPETVVRRLGDEKGRALLDLVGKGGERVFSLANAMGLGKQAEQTGWLQPAHSEAAAKDLQKRVAAWQALGRPVTWLNAEETAARTGMSIYHGALHDASGGVINPLAYVHGLAHLASTAGATIVETAPVTGITERDGGWVVQTPHLEIAARRVVLCTNASEKGIAPRLGHAVLPLTVFQMATEPLPDDAVRRFSPNREPVSDTRANIFTYRLDAANRLISGGMALSPFTGERRMGEKILDRLVSELGLDHRPLLAHAWRGTAAVTTDFLPHLYRLGPGFIGAIGCNGRGVAFTTMLGDVLADTATGKDLDTLPVPLAPARPLPFRRLAGLAPRFYLAKGILNDRRTTKSGPKIK
ncbi:NAD(P)/FAD-dependent oxidoreductase [Nitratireductor kimnyeongensis]|uniref:NAD(P)/FAD-dependent oxidoreductase n=1 Tax=Nitratireductor kimnyeongensis TaxID=430679 RepID=A0ABW0TC69_9HYPH|nr:FAD-dependent oxidoreductase [Nitratireductor kimnyeongensis]QZZ36909.1 FAD-binding oxidoreductase [Nitratireductor kimnyeongensis]